MKNCDHDKIYSGQTNLSQQFAYICRLCGECGWSDVYDLSRVNFDEHCRLRVQHGWASKRPLDASARRGARLTPLPSPTERLRLPAPPRVPTIHTPARRWPLVVGIGYFVFLSAVCLLAAIPWGALGPILPLWLAIVSTGIGLFTVTMLYLVWKQGSN